MLDERTHKQAAYDILSLLQKHYAPTDKERALLTDIHNRYFSTEHSRAICMASVLYDGLAYGNWPWTNFTVVG